MSQVQNLIQMFMNRATTPPASIKGTEAKPVKHAEKTSAPFHAKVVASHAQLAANSAAFKSSETSRSPDKMNGATPSKQKMATHTEKGKAVKPNGNSVSPKIKSTVPKIEKSIPKKTAVEVKANESKDFGTVKKSDTDVKAKSADIQDQNGKAEAALRNRLEKMGITATDEQLSDTEFLKDMLQLLQSMLPNCSGPVPQGHSNGEESQSEASENVVAGNSPSIVEGANAEVLSSTLPDEQDSIDLTETATEKDSGPLVGMGGAQNPIFDKADPLGINKQSTDKDLADLIQDRLVEIAKAAKSQNTDQTLSTRISQDSSQQNWQGIGIHDADGMPSSDPVAMGELDRLRILQAAALNAGGAAESESIHTQSHASTEDNDPINDIGSVSISPVDKAAAHLHQEGQSGDFEGNKEQTPSAPNSILPDGQVVAKDGPAGIVFHNGLSQIRGTEQPAIAESIRAPHAAAFDQGILQQISKKLTGITLRNAGEISIQLEPENLGKIRVGLGLKDGIMTARIGVENENVRQIVEANLSNLRETLENQGITLQGLDVSVDQHHSSLFNPEGSNSEAFFHRHTKNDMSTNNSELPDLEISPESDTGRRWGYNTLEYIG